MSRQTSGWVTCAKPSRRNTDPRVSHTFCRRFLKQDYPKNISDVPSKILEKKEHNYQMFCLKLGVLCCKLKIFIANFSHLSLN